jgi:hypothetical protein
VAAPARPRRQRLTPLEELGSMVLDPAAFAAGLLGHDLWETEVKILRSVAEHDRTAVKACHASGKTFTAADAVMWWTTRYPDGIVITTAPTWTQVKRVLWGEIRKTAQTGRIRFPKLNTTDLEIGPENYAIGLSTNEGVRFQGWHGRILVILDEAPGVLPEIYEAVDGIRAGGQVHVLLLGQPMVIGGYYYDAFHAKRATWNTITISAFDTPNLRGCYVDNGKAGDEHRRYGDPSPRARNLLTMGERDLARNERPYLTTRKWVRDAWYDWGVTESPLWEVKVLGQFPRQTEGALFLLEWIERARRRLPGYESDPLDVGIDVAGPGEAETVVAVRQGPNRIEGGLRAWLKPDPRGDVLAFLAPMKDRIRTLNVDSAGDGYYFAKHLDDNGYKGRVRYVNVGSTDHVKLEKFTNQKGLYYWSLRERARDGRLGGIDDAKEQAQLTTLKYDHDPRGRVVIESKEDMRTKRGLPSPDRAEADMLAFAPPVPIAPRRLDVTSRTYVNR